MSYNTITLETDTRGIATLTLNVPEKHNAMSARMIGELTHIAGELAGDEQIRAVILTGAGRSFCAGADLGWMKQQFEANREKRLKEARSLAHLLKSLNEMPKPLIGKIQGQAYGGGIGLISVCDVVIAVESAKFALTETRLGLIPATIGPYVIARMGEGKARQVFMSAKTFGADEAVSLGLVSRVVHPDDLDGAVEAEIIACLSAAPGAVAAAKALTRKLGPVIDDQLIDETINMLADRWEGKEAQEGIGAFFDKRKPEWIS